MEAVKTAHFAKKQLRSGSTAVMKKNIAFDTIKTYVFFNFSKLQKCDKIVDICFLS